MGQSSECEILDFESVEDSTGAGVAEALNTGMPAGLRVLDCYAAVRPVREMVNLRARLELEYDNGVPENACECIRALFTQDPALIGAAVARHLPDIAPDFVRVRRKEVYDADMNVFR